MAGKWCITIIDTGEKDVTYISGCGEKFHCGRNRADTPTQMIVDWCMDHGDPGDLIVAETGFVWLVQRAAAA